MEKFRIRKKPKFGDPLTKGEVSVLQKIKLGLSRKQIGEVLFVTEQTVAFHSTNIYKKLGVKGKSELIVKTYKKEIEKYILPKSDICFACGYSPPPEGSNTGIKE